MEVSGSVAVHGGGTTASACALSARPPGPLPVGSRTLPHLEASILRGSNAARGHSAMRLVRLLGLWPAERGAAGVQAAAAVLHDHVVLIDDACSVG